jgi:hypothetical protein
MFIIFTLNISDGLKNETEINFIVYNIYFVMFTNYAAVIESILFEFI